jgi:GT2 family glycosyltransferase
MNSLLSTIKKSIYQYEVILIDNGSSDGTVKILSNYLNTYKSIDVVYLEKNYGTTISRNIGLKKSSGKYICLIDSDVELYGNIFEKLIDKIDSESDIGIVVPKIFLPNGTWQKSIDHFPTIQHKINRFFRLRKIEEKEGEQEKYSKQDKYVDCAISAFWLIKRKVLENVGLFDEKYFYAPEDIDYCLSVWKSGFKILYVPEVSVVHHTQEISRGIKFNKGKIEHIKGLFYYFYKNRYLWKRPRFSQKNSDVLSVLFIAYYFPPESSSGSFRPLFFANHLVELGCSVQVLTAKEADFLSEQPIDKQLLNKLNKNVEIHRSRVVRPREALIRFRNNLTGKKHLATSSPKKGKQKSPLGWIREFKDFITDLLATPDPHVGWIQSCVRVGRSIIREGQVDVIWATGGPWSGLVAGVLLKKLTGKPLVADFRDPWVSNPSFKFRSSAGRFLGRYLEKFVVRNANAIIANTKELQEDFKIRYRSISNLNVFRITNGFEQYMPCFERQSERPLTITHTGALYFSRNPFYLLRAISNLIVSGSIDPRDLRLELVGGIGIEHPGINELLEQPFLKNVVNICPRVSFDEAQKFITQSDVLLMLQPDLPLQVPRKLYEYMASGKAIFCISEKEGATAGMMNRFNLGYLCENNINEISQTLLQIYQDWKTGSLAKFQDSHCDECLNKNLAASLHEILKKVKAAHSLMV